MTFLQRHPLFQPTAPATPSTPSTPAAPTAAVRGGMSIAQALQRVQALQPAREPSNLLRRVQEAIALKSGKAITAKRTHVLFVLDGSGSMMQGKELTMAAFNDQLRIVREASEQTGTTTVSLLVFSEQVSVLVRHGQLAQVLPLNHANYRPSGGTALYDALGQAIELVLEAEGFGEPDTAFLVTALTDGEENSSHRHDAQEISRCIQALEATQTVSFSILGPKEHLHTLADVLNIRATNVGGFDTNTVKGRSEGLRSMSMATSSYMSLRAAGSTQAHALYAAPESFVAGTQGGAAPSA